MVRRPRRGSVHVSGDRDRLAPSDRREADIVFIIASPCVRHNQRRSSGAPISPTPKFGRQCRRKAYPALRCGCYRSTFNRTGGSSTHTNGLGITTCGIRYRDPPVAGKWLTKGGEAGEPEDGGRRSTADREGRPETSSVPKRRPEVIKSNRSRFEQL